MSSSAIARDDTRSCELSSVESSVSIASQMAEIDVIGSACGFPIPGHGHSSALLSTENCRTLIDAGEPCSRSLLEAGFETISIDAVFLTHGHADHTGGLPMLIQTAWLSGRLNPLTIFLPKELSEPLQQWLDASYLGPDFLPFQLIFVAWESQPFFEAFGLKIYPTETTHLRSLARRFGGDRFKAYSLRIEDSDFRLVVSGDLGRPDDLESQLSEPVDLLVSELAHFPPIELFRFLSGRKVKKLLLTHFAPELLGNEESVIHSARTELPETVTVVATDGLRVPIPNRSKATLSN